MKPDLLLVGPMMPHVMDAMDQAYSVHRLYEMSDRDAWLAENGAKIRAIGTDGHLGASADLMDCLPNLEIIGCYGVGVDAINLDHARKKGVVVTNTPDVLNDDVANLAVALLLDVSRQIVAADRYVRSGQWLKKNMPLAKSIRDRKVGILGLGRIGKSIAEKLQVFGCRISYHGRREQSDVSYRFFPDLVEMARDSDYVVVICPGGEATRNIVNREVIEALGPEGTLINVARGSVVDEPELVSALVDGRLGAAGLDVFAAEPKVPEELFALDNVVLQPHRGSATAETRRAMGDLVVRNLAAHFAGKTVLTPVT